MNMRIGGVSVQDRNVFPSLRDMRLILEHFGAPLLRDHEGGVLGHVVGERQHHVACMAVTGATLPVLRPCTHHLIEVSLVKSVVIDADAGGEAEDALGLAVHISQLSRQLLLMLNASAGDALDEGAAGRGQAFPDTIATRHRTANGRMARTAPRPDHDIIVEPAAHRCSPACKAFRPCCRTSLKPSEISLSTTVKVCRTVARNCLSSGDSFAPPLKADLFIA